MLFWTFFVCLLKIMIVDTDKALYSQWLSTCVCTKLLQLCPTFWNSGLQPSQLLCAWDSPGKNTWVGCHALLQGDLPDPGIEPTSLMSPALASGFFPTSATWASYYMDTSQIGLGSTCMTLFNFNYLFEDTLLRQSLSEVLGVRTST